MTCDVKGCGRDRYVRGLCTLHYWRARGTGAITDIRPYAFRGATCTVDGCSRPHDARGFCRMHYGRWRRSGEVADIVRDNRCGLPGCDRVRGPGSGHGWCKTHYQAWQKFGDPLGAAWRGGRIRPEKLATYEAATPLIRADLRMANTMREQGRRRDVEFYLARAVTHGRPLTRAEQQFAEGVRMEANRERDQAVLAADVKELTEKGLSSREIGELIGVTERTVIRIRGVLGITQSTWNNAGSSK